MVTVSWFCSTYTVRWCFVPRFWVCGLKLKFVVLTSLFATPSEDRALSTAFVLAAFSLWVVEEDGVWVLTASVTIASFGAVLTLAVPDTATTCGPPDPWFDEPP